MFLHSCTELKQLAYEMEQLRVPSQRCASDKVKFLTTKEEILQILKRLYGETSRQFRVVKLTDSPATVNKVINHIFSRYDLHLPQAKVVNL